MTLNHRRSLAVDDPEIDEVLDLDTGEILPAQIAIGDDYEIALQLRMALRDGIAAEKPLFACPLCAVPVHMVSLRSERRFYFRHEMSSATFFDGLLFTQVDGGRDVRGQKPAASYHGWWREMPHHQP